MRTHKITVLTAFGVAIIMLCLSLLTTIKLAAESNVWISTFQNISIGLMTSAAVTGCTTLALYVIEKSKQQESIYTFLRSTYLNVCVLRELTGGVSIIGQDPKSLNNELRFIDDLAKMIQEDANALYLREYSTIFSSKLQDVLFSDFTKFKSKISSNLRTSTQRFTSYGLTYELMILKEGDKFHKGEPSDIPFDIQLRMHQDTLLSAKSHLHEFEASLAIEADDLLNKFFGVKKKSKTSTVWTDELKKEIDAEISAIVSLRLR